MPILEFSEVGHYYILLVSMDYDIANTSIMTLCAFLVRS